MPASSLGSRKVRHRPCAGQCYLQRSADLFDCSRRTADLVRESASVQPATLHQSKGAQLSRVRGRSPCVPGRGVYRSADEQGPRDLNILEIREDAAVHMGSSTHRTLFALRRSCQAHSHLFQEPWALAGLGFLGIRKERSIEPPTIPAMTASEMLIGNFPPNSSLSHAIFRPTKMRTRASPYLRR